MSSDKFRRETPRRETEVRCQCFAKPELFLPWAQTPEEVKREFAINGAIPCEGGGVPGTWCERCRFGEVLPPEACD